MTQFVLSAFPALIELTEGGTPYGFTITPDGVLAGAAKVRWELVPQGRMPGNPSDFPAMGGALDFAAGATEAQTVTLSPVVNASQAKTVHSFVLRLYEVVGEDDSTSTAGESDDVQLGDDVPVELTDRETRTFSRLSPFDISLGHDVQTAGNRNSQTLNGGEADDFYVITRYQTADISILDEQVSTAASYNLIKFDFGVGITDVTLNEFYLGATFLTAGDMKITLSTGAVVTVASPNSQFWRYQFGDDEALDYTELKTFLGVTYPTAQTGDIRFSVSHSVGSLAAALPPEVVKSNERGRAVAATLTEDVFTFGANASVQALLGEGDDFYVITRFQLGDVTIVDEQVSTAASYNLIKFDFGVGITNVTLNEFYLGATFLTADDMKITLSTGAVATVVGPNSQFWRYQFGDGEVLDYAGLKTFLGVTYPTAQTGDVLFELDTPFVVPLPSAEPAAPDPPPPVPIGPDTGAHYFKWVAAVDADDSGFQRFAVSDDRPAEVPPGEDAFAGNDLFELDDAVPADTVINGGDGDDVYLVKSALAQNITIRDALTGGLGYNLVRFDDDVAVTEIAAGASPFQGAGSSLLSMTITMENENNDSVVVTVWLQNDTRFQIGETGAIDMAEEFFNKYAEGFASVAIDDATPQVGAELAARITDVHGVDESEAITWQWEASADSGGTWATIGADRNTYLPQAGDVGKIIRVTAGYTDNNGNAETVASQSTEAVETPVDAAFTLVANLTIDENLDGSDTAVDIGRVVAEDSNAGDAVAYGLEGVGGTAAPAGFEIGAETGHIIYTGTGLDHEGTPENGIAMVVVATSTGADGTDTEIRREIAVEVEDVNDAPELDVNAGLSVNPGQTLAITESDLHASDEDDSDGDDDIVFTVRMILPRRGALQLFGDHDDDSNTDDMWDDLSAGGFFTQTDINEGRVRYVNTGGTAAEDDSFTFAVGDGDITLPDATFAIDII